MKCNGAYCKRCIKMKMLKKTRKDMTRKRSKSKIVWFATALYDHHKAFTVIPPNPKKRQEIQRKAEAELAALEELRLSRAMAYVSINPSSVGKEMTNQTKHHDTDRKCVNNIDSLIPMVPLTDLDK
uniref:Uncharacterized protein n=1 Tax=Sphaeramia orbicularis TaxID=375764 RepID=A0A673ASX0_9TELE